MRLSFRSLLGLALCVMFASAAFGQNSSDGPRGASLPQAESPQVFRLPTYTTGRIAPAVLRSWQDFSVVPAGWFTEVEVTANCQCENCSCEDCQCSGDTCQCSGCEGCSSACQCDTCLCTICECLGVTCECQGCSSASTCPCENCSCKDCRCSGDTCTCENCSATCQCENCSCEDCQCSGGECQCEGCSTNCSCESCSCTNCECAGDTCQCEGCSSGCNFPWAFFRSGRCTIECASSSAACQCENCSCEDCQCSGGECQCEGCSSSCADQTAACPCTRCESSAGCRSHVCSESECPCTGFACTGPAGSARCNSGACPNGECCEHVAPGDCQCDLDSSCWCGPPSREAFARGPGFGGFGPPLPPPACADVCDNGAPVVAPLPAEIREIAQTRDDMRRWGVDPFAGSCFDQHGGGALQFAQLAARQAERVACPGPTAGAQAWPAYPVPGTWHAAIPAHHPGTPVGPRMAMLPSGPQVPQYVDGPAQEQRRPSASTDSYSTAAPTSYQVPDTSAHLRDIGRQLEEQAAMLEDAADYGRADDLRQLAEDVRHQARMLRAEQSR